MENNFIEQFLEFEEKYNLFDKKIKDFKYWEFIRMRVYANVWNTVLGLQPVFDKAKKVKKISLKHIKDYIFFKKLKKKDILFSSHPRRMKYGNKYICKSTDCIISLLKDRYSYTIIEEPYYAEIKSATVAHYTPIPYVDIIYTDLIERLYEYKKRFFQFFCSKDYRIIKDELKELLSIINKEFNININFILEKIINNIIYIILMEKTYKNILQKISPKMIIMLFYPSIQKLLLIKCAKEICIPVIDVQHGIMTDEDPIFYHFKIKRNYSSIPNYFFAYSKILNSESNCPYVDEIEKHIKYVGNIFLSEQILKYKKQTNIVEKKYILVISQSVLVDIFSTFIKQLSYLLRNNQEYEILIKLHPYENGYIYEKNNIANNVRIIEKTEDIYKYQNIAFVQLGIYSTALYEGIAFGLPTFIIDNVFGSDFSKKILSFDEQGIYYVKEPSEMVNIILCQNLYKPDKKLINYLWNDNPKANILFNIESICNNKK